MSGLANKRALTKLFLRFFFLIFLLILPACSPYRINPARELIGGKESELYFAINPPILIPAILHVLRGLRGEMESPFPGIGGSAPVTIGIRGGLSDRVNFGLSFEPLVPLYLILALISGNGAISFDSYVSFNALDTGYSKINFALSLLSHFESYSDIQLIPPGGGRIQNSILGLGFASGFVIGNFHFSFEPIYFPVASGDWERQEYPSLRFGKRGVTPARIRKIDLSLFMGYEISSEKFNYGFSIAFPGLLNFLEIWRIREVDETVATYELGASASPIARLYGAWTPVIFGGYFGIKLK